VAEVTEQVIKTHQIGAVYGFAAWLTTREDTIVGAQHSAADVAGLVKEYLSHTDIGLENGLEPVFPTILRS
jgi:hypothetical protein